MKRNANFLIRKKSGKLVFYIPLKLLSFSKIIFVLIFCFCGFHVVISQTGPGGVGNSSSNVLWLSSDVGVYNNAGTTLASNSDNVQQWNDRSGNADNAVQATVGNRPNYFTNVINGLPALRFTAANADNLIAASVSTANFASVWAVAAYSSLPPSNPGILIGSPAGTGSNAGPGDKCIGMWVASGSAASWGRGVQTNGTTRDISTSITLAVNTFYIVNNIYRTASIEQFVNNTVSGNNALHNGTLRSWADITVGRQGTETWNGDIAEIILYNVEVNSAQRIIIDNYLAAKYGRTLTSNDVYAQDNAGNGNYDFEVAGIGQVDATNRHDDAQGTGMVRILNPAGLGNNEFLMWGHDNQIAQATNTTDVPVGIQARLERVWRVSEVNATGGAINVGNIDMQWDLNGLGTVVASDLRLLVDTDNDGNFADETGITGASSLGGGIFAFTGVTTIANNRRFTLATISKNSTPLPVTLTFFEAEMIYNRSVNLKWQTASEKNNSYFEVQRSTNAYHWEVLTQIKGEVKSERFKNYSYVDENPKDGISYYRLKQVDTDGKFEFFEVRAVSLKNEEHLVYPNPFSKVINYRAGNITMTPELFDSNGSRVDLESKIKEKNSSEYSVDLSGLNSGIYLLRIDNISYRIVKE